MPSKKPKNVASSGKSKKTAPRKSPSKAASSTAPGQPRRSPRTLKTKNKTGAYGGVGAQWHRSKNTTYAQDSTAVWWVIHTAAGVVHNMYASEVGDLCTKTNARDRVALRKKKKFIRNAFVHLMDVVFSVHLSRCPDVCANNYIVFLNSFPIDPRCAWRGADFETWAYKLHCHANDDAAEHNDKVYIKPRLSDVVEVYRSNAKWWTEEREHRKCTKPHELVFELVDLIPRVPTGLWNDAAGNYVQCRKLPYLDILPLQPRRGKKKSTVKSSTK